MIIAGHTICTVFNIVRHLATSFEKRHREKKATQQRNKKVQALARGGGGGSQLQWLVFLLSSSAHILASLLCLHIFVAV